MICNGNPHSPPKCVDMGTRLLFDEPETCDFDQTQKLKMQRAQEARWMRALSWSNCGIEMQG